MKDFYGNPTRRLIADGALEKLPEILSARHTRRVLLVTGGKSFRASAHYPRLKDLLAGAELVESAGVYENPTVDFVKEFSKRHRKDACDLVLAVGGGSALDVGKLTAVLLNQGESALEAFVARGVRFDGRR